MTGLSTLKARIEARSRIRVLNDNFRSTFIGGRVVMSAGVAELPLGTKAQVLLRVQKFSTFNGKNDPHREHDFGSFTLAGQKYFWKIDYYDLQCELGSEDPADPAKTTRVLTIMFAEEY
jgi:Protein of unknown function (DUF3768)